MPQAENLPTTSADVVDFKRAAPPTEPPKNRFGRDEWKLKLCVEWRVARLLQQRNWAEHELATMWGTLPDKDIELDMRPLGLPVTGCEQNLSRSRRRFR
jgi:hypothetical protein